MYKCESCGAVFEEPADRKEQVGYEPYDVETFGVCPECGSEDFYEAFMCEECGEWFSSEETSTNYFCKECEEKLIQQEIAQPKFTGLVDMCDKLEDTISVDLNAFLTFVFTKREIEEILLKNFFEMPRCNQEISVENFIESDKEQFLEELYEFKVMAKKRRNKEPKNF